MHRCFRHLALRGRANKGLSSAFYPIRKLSSSTAENINALFESGAYGSHDSLHDPDHALLKKFKGIFDESNKTNNIYHVKEGGYVDIKSDVIAKYFPEGLSGEMKDEFEFSGTRTWMVRQSSKLICHIIDEYETTRHINADSGGINSSNKSSDNVAQSSSRKIVPSPFLHNDIKFDGLMDRPPLRSTILQAQCYGVEIFNRVEQLKKLRGKPPVAPENREVLIAEQVELIKASHNGTVPRTILLAGVEGSGKSVTLNQAVLHARQKGWLCLFVNNGWSQSQEGWYIDPVNLDDGTKIYDNSLKSVEVLRGFWKAHNDVLKTLPITITTALAKYTETVETFKEEWVRALSVPGRENFKFLQLRQIIEGEDSIPDQDKLDESIIKDFDFLKLKFETLEDLVLFGIVFRDRAGLIFVDLMNELRLIEHIPILIAVDNYNTWELPSAFDYEQKSVHARELCVPYALKILSTKKAETTGWSLKNGLCICATSNRYSEGRNVTYDEYKFSIPFILRIPNYSAIEYLSAVIHSMKTHCIHQHAEPQEVLAFRLQCGSNPKLLRKEAVGYFFPLAMDKENPEFMMYDEGKHGGSVIGQYDAFDHTFDTEHGIESYHDEDDWAEYGISAFKNSAGSDSRGGYDDITDSYSSSGRDEPLDEADTGDDNVSDFFEDVEDIDASLGIKKKPKKDAATGGNKKAPLNKKQVVTKKGGKK